MSEPTKENKSTQPLNHLQVENGKKKTMDVEVLQPLDIGKEVKNISDLIVIEDILIEKSKKKTKITFNVKSKKKKEEKKGLAKILNDAIDDGKGDDPSTVDIEEKDAPPPMSGCQRGTGVYNINNKKLFLTYATHIDKEKLIDFLNGKSQSDIEEVYVAHETSDKRVPYDHSHVWIKWAKAHISSSSRDFDFPISKKKALHPNIQKVDSKLKVDEIRLGYYISKQDKSDDLVKLREACHKWNRENGSRAKNAKRGEGDRPEWIEGVLACKTGLEAIKKFAYSPKDVSGILQLFEQKLMEGRPKMNPIDHLFFTWTQEMWAALQPNNPWDHRRLTWLVGPKGLDLKSKFASCFVSNFGGVILTTTSGCSNIATLLAEQLKAGGSLKYIFVDLPRAVNGHKMWDTLENMLNGTITVTKYKGHTLYTGDSRIVVFSNWNPPFYPNGEEEDASGHNTDMECPLSQDRWKIGDIVDVVNEKDKQADKIIKWRNNPFHKPDWKKPDRKLDFFVSK